MCCKCCMFEHGSNTASMAKHAARGHSTGAASHYIPVEQVLIAGPRPRLMCACLVACCRYRTRRARRGPNSSPSLAPLPPLLRSNHSLLNPARLPWLLTSSTMPAAMRVVLLLQATSVSLMSSSLLSSLSPPPPPPPPPSPALGPMCFARWTMLSGKHWREREREGRDKGGTQDQAFDCYKHGN